MQAQLKNSWLEEALFFLLVESPEEVTHIVNRGLCFQKLGKKQEPCEESNAAWLHAALLFYIDILAGLHLEQLLMKWDANATQE
jgi:hypothetical protein